jgi:glycosyltransferase involved in cell wall biosynthesis
MRITVHCLVKNEESFVWYAINSVIDYAERVIVWDTGSSDNTVPIIKSIKNHKIDFKEKGLVDSRGVTRLRNEMINETETNWIMILDGDEIWWDKALIDIKNEIHKDPDKYDTIVNPVTMLVGDIYHKQEAQAGKYRIHKKYGHYNLRFVRAKVNNLRAVGVYGHYPYESYINNSGVKIQNFPSKKIYFSSEPYLHASHLLRSTKSKIKFKYEIGDEIPRDFYYPEVFFKPRPGIVPSPWKTIDRGYKLRALFETPLKKIKRRLI